MAFAAGDEAWMVVMGDATEGAGLHEVRIHEVKGDKVLITREAWVDEDLREDPYDPSNKAPRQFRELTPEDNVLLNANETETKNALPHYDKDSPDGEGLGHAIVYRKDAEFVEGGVDDMVQMKQLNDAELARNLKIKFKAHTGYVRCGPTLVALNLMGSYKTTQFPEGAYHHSLFERFHEMPDQEHERPHVWALASHCFKQAFAPLTPTHQKSNQALIITGESGAGKTFNTKQILDFLAWVGGGEEQKKLTNKMLSTTPILEGFGNANMPRNPDSSRFGKLYKIYFNKQDRKLTACSITPYMLEKSRVSAQQMNERNFHVFYRMLHPPVDITQTEGAQSGKDVEQMLARLTIDPENDSLPGEALWWSEGGKRLVGLPPAKRAMCKLEGFEDYVYLNGGSKMRDVAYTRIHGDIPKDWVAVPDGTVETICPEGPRVFEDAYNMSEMLASLYGFFDEAQVDTILKTVAGVLHLGNVDILGDKDVCEGVDKTGKSGEALAIVAELWQVPIDLLENALYMVTIPVGRNKWASVPCNKGGREGGIVLRDTVARMVYDQLFMWIVERCSGKLAKEMGGNDLFLGVLDIFGFEFYENHQIKPPEQQVVNGLDQLNINICNEVLQQQFVKVIFNLEICAYQDQKINFSFDGYQDNAPACNFLTKPREPLLSALATPAKMKKSGKEADVLFMETLSKAAKESKLVDDNKGANPAGILLDFNGLRGKRPFNGLEGGPYGFLAPKNDQVKAVNESFVEKGAGKCPAFGIRHYAAEVAYDCRGWIQKDKSAPSDEMIECLGKSSDTEFLCPTFTSSAAQGGNSTPGVTAAFCKSLDELISTLGHCDMSFVRCLKASNPLAKGIFQSALVLKQLKYTGMLDTLKIRRFGFPSRMGNQEFVDWGKTLTSAHNISLIPEAGSAADKAKIAAQNAKTIAEHLQSEYAEAVFAELPSSDQRDPSYVSQKSQVVVCGTPSNPSKTAALVMMRDWFFRGADKRVKQVLKAYSDIARAAVLGAVHEKLVYGRAASSCKHIGGMLRALSARSVYLMDKQHHLASGARTEVSAALRAYSSRQQYIGQRNQFFEATNRRKMQTMMHAVVVRQLFFERKIIYSARRLERAEAKRMKKQLDIAVEEARLARQEKAEEAEQRALMLKEEQYTREIEFGKLMQVVLAMKAEVQGLADEQMDKARAAYASVSKTIAYIDGHERKYQENKQRVDYETSTRIKATLRQMGVISEGRSKLALPQLHPMPNEFSDRHVRKNYLEATLQGLAQKNGQNHIKEAFTEESKERLVNRVADAVEAEPDDIRELLQDF